MLTRRIKGRWGGGGGGGEKREKKRKRKKEEKNLIFSRFKCESMAFLLLCFFSSLQVFFFCTFSFLFLLSLFCLSFVLFVFSLEKRSVNKKIKNAELAQSIRIIDSI